MQVTVAQDEYPSARLFSIRQVEGQNQKILQNHLAAAATNVGYGPEAVLVIKGGERTFAATCMNARIADKTVASGSEEGR